MGGGHSSYRFKLGPDYPLPGGPSVSLLELAEAVDPHRNHWRYGYIFVSMNNYPIRKMCGAEKDSSQISLVNAFGRTYYHIGYGW